MKPSLVATFTIVDVLLVVTPGPDWAYVLAVGSREQTILPAVAGLLAGYAALTVLVAAGLAVLLAATPAALTAVTLIGGGYLIWLGASIVSRPVQREVVTDAPRPRSALRLAAAGAGTSGLNPKGLLLFVAVLPQFVDRPGGLPVAIQIGVLGAIHMSNCAVGYAGVGWLARNMLGTRPHAAQSMTRAAGGVMIILGALLVLERASGWI
jgi:threonine/homoserine/homoserine lactone efflux protein